MGEMASQQERLQLVETGQPKHGVGETSSQREAEGQQAHWGELLNAILHRPSADDVTRPPLFSIHLTLFLFLCAPRLRIRNRILSRIAVLITTN